MTKKRTITARDAEDMTKIILVDAITAEQDRLAKGLLKMEKATNWRDVKRAIVQLLFPNMLKWDFGGLVVEYGSEEMNFRGDCPMLQDKKGNAGYYDTVVVVANEKQWKTITDMIAKNKKKEDEHTSKGARLVELREKLENYKDLAARFRLGFTGDASDLDAVNHKCRSYLLEEKKA